MTAKRALEIRKSAWMKLSVQVNAHDLRELCDDWLDYTEQKAGFRPIQLDRLIIAFVAGIGFSLCLFASFTPGSRAGEGYKPAEIYGNGPAKVYSSPLQEQPQPYKEVPCK